MNIHGLFAAALLTLLAAGFIACNGIENTSSLNTSGIRMDTQLKYEDNLFYPAKGDTPFTGEVKWHYQNGALAARIGYDKGHLVRRESFYKNGQKMDLLERTSDTLLTSITWYPSGQMRTKYDRGLVKQWYENGQIRAVWNTDSSGVLEGKATAWYPDGTLLGIEHYENGELEGQRTLYDSTGTVTVTGIYNDGKRQAEN